MRYQTKKDLWLTLTLWAIVIIPTILLTHSLINDSLNKVETIIIISLLFVIDIFLIWLWCSTYYLITDSKLIVHYGPFKKVIQLDSIQSVQKSSNILSGPALSTKRIEIIYGHYKFILISPEDRDHFIALLLEKYPHIIIKP